MTTLDSAERCLRWVAVEQTFLRCEERLGHSGPHRFEKDGRQMLVQGTSVIEPLVPGKGGDAS